MMVPWKNAELFLSGGIIPIILDQVEGWDTLRLFVKGNVVDFPLAEFPRGLQDWGWYVEERQFRLRPLPGAVTVKLDFLFAPFVIEFGFVGGHDLFPLHMGGARKHGIEGVEVYSRQRGKQL